jgi:selenocysteine lyase/cysteine desulfurase
MRVLERSARRPPPPALAPALPPLETLLGLGGDQRLVVDTAGLNIYGCSRTPRPQALGYSSSTASTISSRAWRRAARLRHQLSDGHNYDDLVEAARTELAQHLGLAGTGAAIVFAPSGTDAVLHALAIARARIGAPLMSILAAADETGSGVPFAASGRHFARTTAQGCAVTPGEPIAGLADGVELIPVPLRDAAGAVRPAKDTDLAILRAAAGKPAVLFAMDHSKLGNRSPSDDCLAEIEAMGGLVVVDACQMRLGLARLQHHLSRGRLVLITGSKFFGGPPLSGALLVPAELAVHMATVARLPAGLADYSVASDWPRGWPAARKSLDARRNVGQLLRWSAALEEMAEWFAVPRLYRDAALRGFRLRAARAMAGHDEVALLDWPGAGDDDLAAPTILPFLVPRNGVALTPAECGKIHRALNRDVTGALPGLRGEERGLAVLPCHIGQPVVVPGLDGPRGVLRVSAGARFVTETASDADAAMHHIFAKIGLLVRNFEAIERAD